MNIVLGIIVVTFIGLVTGFYFSYVHDWTPKEEISPLPVVAPPPVISPKKPVKKIVIPKMDTRSDFDKKQDAFVNYIIFSIIYLTIMSIIIFASFVGSARTEEDMAAGLVISIFGTLFSIGMFAGLAMHLKESLEKKDEKDEKEFWIDTVISYIGTILTPLLFTIFFFVILILIGIVCLFVIMPLPFSGR